MTVLRRAGQPEPGQGAALSAGDTLSWQAPGDLAAAVGDDRLVAYALAADPVFNGMRALIGQLSGILILAQARRCRDVGDLPDIAVARERWNEVVHRLAQVKAPEARLADLGRLKQAVAQVNAAIAIMAEMRPATTDESVAGASARLKVAYQLMQGACDHRLGLSMVDVGGACCSCGSKLA
jgi:hypothetical protein